MGSRNGHAHARLRFGLELRNRAICFFLRERLAVPAFFVGDERDAGAFNRPGDDRKRLISLADRVERFDDLLHVLAVDDRSAPAEGGESVTIDFQCDVRKRWVGFAPAG